MERNSCWNCGVARRAGSPHCRTCGAPPGDVLSLVNLIGAPLLLFALGAGVSMAIVTVATLSCVWTPSAPRPSAPLPASPPTSDPTVVPVDDASDAPASGRPRHHWRSHKSRPWGARPNPAASRPPDA